MLFFSQVLPQLRSKVESDMRLPGLPKDKVLATIVWLLENTYIRIGNDAYAKENQHYGLTTLRNKHVDVDGAEVTFEFVGKSGKKHKVSIRDRRVTGVIRKLEELPGYELFQYVGSDGTRHLVDSGDVNEYLQSITGEGISAKDFRTWGGTVLSAVTLRDLGDFETPTQLKKNLIESVKRVSKHLGNTTTVCRTYYIHPIVPSSYEKKLLIPHFANLEKRLAEKPEQLEPDEFAVALLLKDQAD